MSELASGSSAESELASGSSTQSELASGPVVVCLDLDRTTIYSAAALSIGPHDRPDDRPDDRPADRADRIADLHCVEVHRGAPLSFMTGPAVRALRELQRVATVVPTTSRTPEQLARVRLPGPPAQYAIATNGGHLLVDGEPDAAWSDAVRRRLTGCTPLVEVTDHLRARSGPFVLRLRTASDLFAYAVVDRPLLPPGWVEELVGWCAPRGWVVSLQGRKVYAVPRPLTKSAAAAEVLRRCGSGTLLAAGDSLLDADLLDAADLAIRPAHGELADTGFTRPHLAVTTATGAAAGAELLEWLGRAVIDGRR